jgi:hypothetical protein
MSLVAPPFEFVEPSIVKKANLPNPSRSTLRQFRMIFVFPCPRRFAQRLALAPELDFTLG